MTHVLHYQFLLIGPREKSQFDNFIFNGEISLLPLSLSLALDWIILEPLFLTANNNQKSLCSNPSISLYLTGEISLSRSLHSGVFRSLLQQICRFRPTFRWIQVTPVVHFLVESVGLMRLIYQMHFPSPFPFPLEPKFLWLSIPHWTCYNTIPAAASINKYPFNLWICGQSIYDPNPNSLFWNY